jgi:hypothetical protein
MMNNNMIKHKSKNPMINQKYFPFSLALKKLFSIFISNISVTGAISKEYNFVSKNNLFPFFDK